MASLKTTLKAAKSALDSQNWEDAASQSREVLKIDSKNYFGNVFLGRALEKQGQSSEAESAYRTATDIKPAEDLAWKGLVSTLEAQKSKAVSNHTEASLKLAELYADANDQGQCQEIVNKATQFAKEYGTRLEYKAALEITLPTSPIYDFLEGRLPAPASTFIRLAEITEAIEKERINKEIGERRTRLGAKIGQVTSDVRREVYSASDVETLYEKIIDWTSDDETRRLYEEKLLQRAYDLLIVLYPEEKVAKRKQVLKLAHDMVLIKHPFALAWKIELDWKDFESFDSLDIGIIREYIHFFPKDGLSSILEASRGVKSVTERTEDEEQEGDAEKPEEIQISSEDRLILLTEGLGKAKTSPFAHRLAADYFLQIGEHEVCAETARKGKQLLRQESLKSGLKLQSDLDALNISLGTSLVYYQAPKNHPEARELFEDILSRIPNNTSALLGIGLIFKEQEEYVKASQFLASASERDPDNIAVRAEAAWCLALSGSIEDGLETLQTCLEMIDIVDQKSRELKAETSFRVGKCMWDLHPDKTSRKSRDGPYARFLAAIKLNPELAPAYTALGVYYSRYAKDKKRARQCFQKAFELSPTEAQAAEQLARVFADEREWEIVELIGQRVIDTGIVRAPPGSKRKSLSWPYAALGIAQMSKQEFNLSIVSFQAALRISPNDYHCWVSLGESYYNSGRYNAARRALEHARNVQQEKSASQIDFDWFATYMLANVDRELGEYDEALKGYHAVLEKVPSEYGVLVALLQALVEQSRDCLEKGFFGLAVDKANQAISTAIQIHQNRADAFNLWKAIGDACSVIAAVKPGHLLTKDMSDIFAAGPDVVDCEKVTALDGIGSSMIHAMLEGRNNEPKSENSEESSEVADGVNDGVTKMSLLCSIFAQKQSIGVANRESAGVAWYNLGWAEYRLYAELKEKPSDATRLKPAIHYIKAAVQCFKRAIELEAGNAGFWNALGVVTTLLNPKVAQHSFVRSLHINENNAMVWTNLGVLYLINNDIELAHNAFARAQSVDPTYANAWVGEGLIALQTDDAHEALSHFTHAYDISEASSLPARKEYSVSLFDHLLSSPKALDTANLISPVFALRQIKNQQSSESYQHLLALMLERIGDSDAAIEQLNAICASAEARYEMSESDDDLAKFASSKVDLARNELAAGEFESAADNASTALDLAGDLTSLDEKDLEALRLSAHMTQGLAHYYNGDMDSSIAAFKTALEESSHDVDVSCLLAKVLWAKGGEQERRVAREQLVACGDKGDAAKILQIIARLDPSSGTSLRTSMSAAQTAVLLAPYASQGWNDLTDAAEAESKSAMDLTYPPQMGLVAALIRPKDAQALSTAFARTGSAADAQRAICVSPWQSQAWASLYSSVS